MTEQELRIARLSKIMNSGLRVQSEHGRASLDAYGRVVNELERNLEQERNFAKVQERKQRLLELAEREQEFMKDSVHKHHLAVLQKQIEEKKQRKMSEDKQVVVEKELSEETYKPRKFNIKQMLDAQIEEKKRIGNEVKEKECGIDRLRLEIARKSLESEMKSKWEGKQKLQDQLKESWEKTQKTTQLKRKIERLRRFGENYVPEEDENQWEGLENFEDFGSRTRKSVDSSPGKQELRRKRSKSMLGGISTASQREVIRKINELDERQSTIEKQKIDILSYLESKSQSKGSSRLVRGSNFNDFN